MTIFYPDISHHQAGLQIRPGTIAVSTKASKGTTSHDPSYADFKSQAQWIAFPVAQRYQLIKEIAV
jgi:hypothetical protein